MSAVPNGIFPMLYAFFDAGGRLDRRAMARQVEAAVASGAHGIAVLGLGTEVGKLSGEERSELMDWVSHDLAGRRALCVTVAENSVEAAIAATRSAEDAGAAFVILQPPAIKGLPEEDYISFFGRVADAAEVPVGIQNAPDYIGIGLSNAGILKLAGAHPNLRLVKAEGSALYAAELVEATGGSLAVFNGRCGLELTDNLRAGCAGMIPAVDVVDVQVRIFEAMARGEEAEAERLYASILPLIVFVMQSLDSFLCYGKRITAIRLGLGEVFDRQPALRPSRHGLAWTQRFASALPRFEI